MKWREREPFLFCLYLFFLLNKNMVLVGMIYISNSYNSPIIYYFVDLPMFFSSNIGLKNQLRSWKMLCSRRSCFAAVLAPFNLSEVLNCFALSLLGYFMNCLFVSSFMSIVWAGSKCFKHAWWTYRFKEIPSNGNG